MSGFSQATKKHLYKTFNMTLTLEALERRPDNSVWVQTRDGRYTSMTHAEGFDGVNAYVEKGSYSAKFEGALGTEIRTSGITGKDEYVIPIPKEKVRQN